MSLNKKDLLMLEEISDKKVLPISYFAEKYHVSERNIRYAVENINFYLKKEGLTLIGLKKGNLEVDMDFMLLQKFIERIDVDTYSFSKEERENFILISYLFRKNPRISELENYLKVSRPTIKKDILSIMGYLKKFELEFIKDENRLLIVGKEKKLRHLKLLKLMDYVKISSDGLEFFSKKYFNEKKELEIIKDYLKDFDVSLIMNTISSLETELDVTFELSFKNIMGLYFIPTIERIKENRIIVKKNNSEFLKNLKDYQLIKKILSKVIPSQFEYEILHLTEYFLSGYYSNDFSENIYIVEKYINKLSQTLSIEFGENFIENKDFSDELLKYLLPAIYRIKNNFCLNNSLDEEIISSERYQKIKKAVSKNNQYLKEPLRDEEIYFIHSCVEKVLKNKNTEKISLKTLLDIVSKNSKEVDLDEISDGFLNYLGNRLKDDREESFNFGIEKLLSSSRIFLIDEEISLTKALDSALHILNRQKYIKSLDDYELKDMVKKFGRYMFIEKNILFCYEKNRDNCIKPGLALIISKYGIVAGEEDRGNFFFLLTARNRVEHLKIISQLIKLTDNQEFIKEVLQLKTSLQIMKKIREYLKIVM